jgi:hypothetical protein
MEFEMKKLAVLFSITFLALATQNAKADYMQENSGVFGASLAGTFLLINPAAGLTTGAGLILSSRQDSQSHKELVKQMHYDVQNYNINGELSPLLNDMVTSLQKTNSELSIEDALNILQNIEE